MYVCLCNALTTRDVNGELQNGCGSVAGIYKRLGCRPQCGKCVTDVRRLVQSAKAAVTRIVPEASLAGGD